MNGLGGGGDRYQSEDDFDDYNSKPSSAIYGNNAVGGSSGSGAPQSSMPTFGGSQGNSRPQSCCLIDDGRRCSRLAGNASYNKRIQKNVHYKRLRLEIDLQAHHTYICDHHKMVIQNARARQKRDSDEELGDIDNDPPEVDLYQLQVNTLRKYKKHYKIATRPGLNKAQLAEVLMKHFKTIPVHEKETVTYFIYQIKQDRHKTDMRHDVGDV